MASAVVPGPMMLRSLSTTSSPLESVIVPVTPNTMESPGAESAMTCRSEPGPLSAREVTVFVSAWARVVKALVAAVNRPGAVGRRNAEVVSDAGG